MLEILLQADQSLEEVEREQHSQLIRTIDSFRGKMEDTDPKKLLPALDDAILQKTKLIRKVFEDQRNSLQLKAVKDLELWISERKLTQAIVELKALIKENEQKMGLLRQQLDSLRKNQLKPVQDRVASLKIDIYGGKIAKLLFLLFHWDPHVEKRKGRFKELLTALSQQWAPLELRSTLMLIQMQLLDELDKVYAQQVDKLQTKLNNVNNAKALMGTRHQKATSDLHDKSFVDNLKPFTKIRDFKLSMDTGRLESYARQLRAKIDNLSAESILAEVEGLVKVPFKSLEATTIKERLEEQFAQRELFTFLVREIIRERCRPLFPGNSFRQDTPLERTINIALPLAMNLDLGERAGRMVNHNNPNEIDILVTEHDRSPQELVTFQEYSRVAADMEASGKTCYPERNWEEMYKPVSVLPQPVSEYMVILAIKSIVEKGEGGWFRWNGTAINGKKNLIATLADREVQQQIKSFWSKVFAEKGVQGVLEQLTSNNVQLDEDDQRRLEKLVAILKETKIESWKDLEAIFF